MPPTISIDQLIEIVNNGGTVKTGIDVYDKRGRLLLQKDVQVNNISTILIVKKAGLTKIPIFADQNGGLWDNEGRQIKLPQEKTPTAVPQPVENRPVIHSPIEKRVKEIQNLKKEATQKYQRAKSTLKKSISDIKNNNGRFDVVEVRDTVDEIFNFLETNQTAFSFLTKEILTYDDYLYNHSINVCTIGTAILHKFQQTLIANDTGSSLLNLQKSDLRDISLGFFLHDVGKTLIPKNILNKNGPLTDQEFELIKSHSFAHGTTILQKNNISNPFTKNTALLHHCPLYEGEKRCYPADIEPDEVPLYVKICKLADIYDAMTSKRSYKDAMNPAGVVTDIFRHYAGKGKKLQFILHSFVKAVGIYPPGSIVTLCNGQLAFIMDSSGPIAIPFTDQKGDAIKKYPPPIDMGIDSLKAKGQAIDRTKPLIDPIEVYDLLPEFLKNPR